jgi:hypothetical protein
LEDVQIDNFRQKNFEGEERVKGPGDLIHFLLFSTDSGDKYSSQSHGVN